MLKALVLTISWFLVLLFPEGAKSETIVSGGVSRHYLLHVPSNIQPGAPLLLVLHGGGGDPSKAAAYMRDLTGFDRIADREGFAVAYPTGGGIDKRGKAHWNDGRMQDTGLDDFLFLSDLSRYLVSTYSLDETRVFMSGISNGGIMSYAFAGISGSRPELARVAAIAPVAAAVNTESASKWSMGYPISIFSIFGSNDRLIPRNGGQVAFGRGYVLSQRNSRELMRLGNRCDSVQSVRRLRNQRRDPLTSYIATEACPLTNATISYVTVVGGGHTWPGVDQCPSCSRMVKRLYTRLVGRTTFGFDASEEIWKFFSSVPRTAPCSESMS